MAGIVFEKIIENICLTALAAKVRVADKDTVVSSLHTNIYLCERKKILHLLYNKIGPHGPYCWLRASSTIQSYGRLSYNT